MPSSISDSLRHAIVASRLSHVALEQATGVDRASISRFVARERSLRLDKADRLAAFLALSIRGETMTAILTPNVFVYSAASEAARLHYRQTMQSGLKLAQVVGFIEEAEDIYALREAYPDGTVFLWGGRAGGPDEGYWQQMTAGDLALCYRERRIVSYSFLVTKVKSAALGRFAWPDERSRPFDLVYFLSKPTDIDKPVAELSKYLGEVYQGLRRVAATDEIIRDFGSIEAFVKDALST
jgi:hypothetical protein